MSLAALPEYVFDDESVWVLLSEMGKLSATFAGFDGEDVLLAMGVGDAKRLMAHAAGTKGLIEAEIQHTTGIYRLPLKLDGAVPGEAGIINVRLLFQGAKVEHVQRREAFRVKVLINAQVIFGDERRKHDAMTLDLSETGAGLWVRDCPPGFDVGNNITVFMQNESLGDFEVDAVVMRIFDASTYAAQLNAYDMSLGRAPTTSPDAKSFGVRFVGMSADEVGNMRNYLWYLQRQKRAQND